MTENDINRAVSDLWGGMCAFPESNAPVTWFEVTQALVLLEDARDRLWPLATPPLDPLPDQVVAEIHATAYALVARCISQPTERGAQVLMTTLAHAREPNAPYMPNELVRDTWMHALKTRAPQAAMASVLMSAPVATTHTLETRPDGADIPKPLQPLQQSADVTASDAASVWALLIPSPATGFPSSTLAIRHRLDLMTAMMEHVPPTPQGRMAGLERVCAVLQEMIPSSNTSVAARMTWVQGGGRDQAKEVLHELRAAVADSLPQVLGTPTQAQWEGVVRAMAGLWSHHMRSNDESDSMIDSMCDVVYAAAVDAPEHAAGAIAVYDVLASLFSEDAVAPWGGIVHMALSYDEKRLRTPPADLLPESVMTHIIARWRATNPTPESTRVMRKQIPLAHPSHIPLTLSVSGLTPVELITDFLLGGQPERAELVAAITPKTDVDRALLDFMTAYVDKAPTLGAVWSARHITQETSSPSTPRRPRSM